MWTAPVSKLLAFLEEEFGSTFKAYYDGDPDRIPVSNMPCIVVVKNSDQASNGPTGMQRVTEQLVVKVIFNKSDDWSATVDPTNLTEKRVRDIVEARDPETGGYLPSTLKHALLARFTYEGFELDQSLLFELGILPRTDELITQEGHLTLNLTYLVPNPTRSQPA